MESYTPSQSTIAVFLILVGIGITLWGLQKLPSEMLLAAWQPVDATLTSVSAISTGSRPSQDGSEYSSYFTVTYRFEAEGHTVTRSGEVAHDEYPGGSTAKSLAWQRSHPVGSSIRVYYQPGNPYVSSLRPRRISDHSQLQMGTWLVIEGMILFVSLPWWGHIIAGVSIFILSIEIWLRIFDRLQKSRFPAADTIDR